MPGQQGQKRITDSRINTRKGTVIMVTGQAQRHMDSIKRKLADQMVKGIIIASEDDRRINRALSVTNNIEFYEYKISFKLTKTVV